MADDVVVVWLYDNAKKKVFFQFDMNLTLLYIFIPHTFMRLWLVLDKCVLHEGYCHNNNLLLWTTFVNIEFEILPLLDCPTFPCYEFVKGKTLFIIRLLRICMYTHMFIVIFFLLSAISLYGALQNYLSYWFPSMNWHKDYFPLLK